MKIILDTREHDLKLVFLELKQKDKYKDIIVENETLDLGDILIKDDEDNDIVLIERKTISDLVSSIKDGRYNEQSMRLTSLNIPNHNIIYLIERTAPNIEIKNLVDSTIFSLNYYKGFSIYRSMSTKDTGSIIFNIFLKLQKDKKRKPHYKKHNLIKDLDDKFLDSVNDIIDKLEEPKYCTVIKKKKNENITEENFGEIVLCQIPSISSVTAIAIMKEFKTINNLIEEIKKDNKILDNIRYETKDNKKRKINKSAIQNILKFLNK